MRKHKKVPRLRRRRHYLATRSISKQSLLEPWIPEIFAMKLGAQSLLLLGAWTEMMILARALKYSCREPWSPTFFSLEPWSPKPLWDPDQILITFLPLWIRNQSIAGSTTTPSLWHCGKAVVPPRWSSVVSPVVLFLGRKKSYSALCLSTQVYKWRTFRET